MRHFDGRHAFVAPEQGMGAATYIIIEYEDLRGACSMSCIPAAARCASSSIARPGLCPRVPAGRRPATARGPHLVDAAAASWPGFALVGYDTDRTSYQPGQLVYLQLWWRADAPVTTDWTVFTHLLGPARRTGAFSGRGRMRGPARAALRCRRGRWATGAGRVPVAASGGCAAGRVSDRDRRMTSGPGGPARSDSGRRGSRHHRDIAD